MAGTTSDTSGHEHFQHAPEQSALERELSKGLTSLEKYSNQILIGCLVAAVVLVGGIVWYRSTGTRDVAAWNAFAECRAPEDFIVLADKYPDAPVGEWSRLEAGKMFVSEGLMQALTNRSASDASLNKAKEAYETLLKKKSAAPELRQEALYGMATCLEALSNGDTKPAIDAYEELLKEYPNTPHKLWAEVRIKELKTNNAQSFYAWFRKQDPKPADRPGPKDIPALKSLMPDLDIEDGTDSSKPKDGEQAPALPDGTMPEKPAQPAAEFPPGTEKPTTPPAGEAADAKPAAPVPGDKPAETPPATPAPTVPEADAKPEVKPEAAPENKPVEPAS